MPELEIKPKSRMPKTVDKEWGYFEQYALNEPCSIKLLYVNKGEQLSIQKHSLRSELFVVVKGTCNILIGKTWIRATEGNKYFIPVGKLHSIQADTESVVVLEVVYDKFDEDDIERVKDKYGRVK